VREGRKREFAQYPEFADPAMQARVPDATAPATFEAAKLDWAERSTGAHAMWLARYRRLIEIRRQEIVPRLANIAPGGDCRMLGPAAIHLEWRFGDGARLVLLANFGAEPVELTGLPAGRLLYATGTTPGSSIPSTTAAFYLGAASG
jgi:1,4-alpha-glucan branching enzyme